MAVAQTWLIKQRGTCIAFTAYGRDWRDCGRSAHPGLFPPTKEFEVVLPTRYFIDQICVRCPKAKPVRIFSAVLQIIYSKWNKKLSWCWQQARRV